MVEIIEEKKFTIAILDLDKDTLIMYSAALAKPTIILNI